MQISSSNSSGSSDTLFNAAPFAQARKAFLSVGSALESGDLAAAKTALTDFQKNVPSRSDANNPVAQKIATLSQALDSGDLSAAKAAFAEATTTLAKGPRGQDSAGRPQGAGTPATGAAQTSAASATSGTTTKVYDVRDTNKDGRVSMKEELAYDAEHILASTATSSNSSGTDQSGTVLNVLA